MREELKNNFRTAEETKAHDFIFSMLEGDDVEEDYTNSIPFLDLTTSPESDPRTTA